MELGSLSVLSFKHFLLAIFVLATLTSVAFAHISTGAEDSVKLSKQAWKRGAPQAPNGYVPAPVDCPSTRPSIRSADALSDQELEWLEARRASTVPAMRDLLARCNIAGFDSNAYIDSNRDTEGALPNIGIAVSGGGYRALLNGAGALAAFDSRTPNSTSAGHIGGVLQAATYVSALSGGGWLVGSLYMNNFSSVQEVIDTTPSDGSLWEFENSILAGPDTLGTLEYWGELIDSVTNKAAAGFDTSITDLWSRALSFQLIDAPLGGPAYTYSSIADDSFFRDGEAPMPILVAVGRAPGELVIPQNATVYEFNPFEMGSFDPTTYAFAPIRYIGSAFERGRLPDNEDCIAGFDNAGFIMGTSSSLFNAGLLQLNTTDAVPEELRGAATTILTSISEANNDIADYTPNPFFRFNEETNIHAGDRRLTLVDGGEDLQNIPFHPLIQPFRNVDVIFGIDSSADTTTQWPNGASIIATYERSLNASMANNTAFPAVPDNNTFVNLELVNRPTFFGCDPRNISGTSPLIVYLPNSPYVFNSNTSTFDLQYNNSERNAIINNGYAVATMGNGTRDPEWPACVGCAILSRSFDRTETEPPEICTRCFQRYCWDGTTDPSPVDAYLPEPALTLLDISSGSTELAPSGYVFMTVVAAALFWLL